jgi:AbrB family looped-hinge helix DNA binding protein
MYSTITSKGQVTLPAPLRHRLGFRPGLRVAMREVDGTIVIDQPDDIAAIRARAEAEMRAAGTWGQDIDPDLGWAEAATDRLGRRG